MEIDHYRFRSKYVEIDCDVSATHEKIDNYQRLFSQTAAEIDDNLAAAASFYMRKTDFNRGSLLNDAR